MHTVHSSFIDIANVICIESVIPADNLFQDKFSVVVLRHVALAKFAAFGKTYFSETNPES